MNAEENKQMWKTPEIVDLDVMETKGKSSVSPTEFDTTGGHS